VAEIARSATALLGGAPDVLVNAAGSFALAPFVETDPATFDAQLAVNLRAPFLVVRAFLPAMLARGSGHVVDVGSVAGRVALPGNAAYGASKSGLRGLHAVLAEELRGTGLRATLIEPAATDTSLWDDLDPDSRDDLPSRAAMLRPEDVARTVLFVVSQPAGVEISELAIRSIL
jgi:NAD(P)-dependent dehydrogenase (short-subunit alcohol dehydrogenase family)